jgi:hypothetical protein
MKIVTANAGKKTVTISRKEWQDIGKKTGWMKSSQSEDFVNFMDSLDEGNPAKLNTAIRMIIHKEDSSSFGALIPERDFDKMKLDQIFGKHEFNAQPETIKELARKLWYGVGSWDSDKTSKYALIVDGKAVNW